MVMIYRRHRPKRAESFGVAIEKQPPRYRKPRLKTFSITLGPGAEQNPLLWAAGSNGIRIEHATGTEAVQSHAAHEQQSSGTHAEESPTAVVPGTHLPDIKIDSKATEVRKPDQHLLGPD
jgi:hypothetical protein